MFSYGGPGVLQKNRPVTQKLKVLLLASALGSGNWHGQQQQSNV